MREPPLRCPVLISALRVAQVGLLVSVLGCVSVPDFTNYTPIPGTKISLVIPDGFWLAESFQGIEGANQTSILVTEAEQPEPLMREEFSEERLSTRGMELLATEVVKRVGRDRILFHVAQFSPDGRSLRRWILVSGDDESTSVLVATAPVDSADGVRASLERCLRTAKRDPKRTIGIFDGLGFSVEETELMEISGRASNIVSLVRRGSAGPATPGDPHVVVGRSQLSESVDLESFSTQRLAETPAIARIAVISRRHYQVDGLPAFEVIASAVDARTETDVTIFQAIARNDQQYFLVQGRVSANQEKSYLPQFQEIAASLQRAH